MNYETMSDFEVNKKLAKLLNLSPTHHGNQSDSDIWCNCYPSDCYGWVNYCNSWSDFGPLIEEYGVDVFKMVTIDDMWSCDIMHSMNPTTMHKNPKRAAAICIIKLLEANSE